jgi:phospholipid/cholesterol/gamma-HCH transport system permease protein
MTGGGGWIKKSGDAEPPVLEVGGDWRVDQLSVLSREVERALPAPSAAGAALQLDARGVTAIDSAGAWLLFKLTQLASARGYTPKIEGLDPDFQNLIERASRAAEHLAQAPTVAPINPVLRQLNQMGERVFDVFDKMVELTGFLGLTTVSIVGAVLRPWRIQIRATIKHIELTGLNALPIIGLLAFLIGVVIAYMGAVQLKKFGAEIFTVDLVGIAVLRELGVLFAAILVAGRSGSAFTAQIGTMKVNQEIDAMQTIGLDPVDVLVLPRILALVIALPLLTVYADLVGLAGGAVICATVLNISTAGFITELSTAINTTTFWIGMSKAPVFAFVIALIGCFEGLKVSGSAESVGRRTTTSVVESIFMVIGLDAAFAITLSFLGI